MSQPQCRGCRAIIRWLRTPAGKPTPVDPEKIYEWITEEARPGARKITLVSPEGQTLTGWQATVITPGARQIAGFIPHWSTCPQAAQFKRAKESA